MSQQFIRIIKTTREEEGSCNNCSATDYIVIWKVCIIPIGFSMRLCTACKKKFMKEIKELQ